VIEASVVVIASNSWVEASVVVIASNSWVSNKSLVNITVTFGIFLVPLYSGLETLFPRHLLFPSKFMELGGVNCVTKVVEFPVRHSDNELFLLVCLPKNANKISCYLDVG
jgi:hypothetical protein